MSSQRVLSPCLSGRSNDENRTGCPVTHKTHGMQDFDRRPYSSQSESQSEEFEDADVCLHDWDASCFGSTASRMMMWSIRVSAAAYILPQGSPGMMHLSMATCESYASLSRSRVRFIRRMHADLLLLTRTCLMYFSCPSLEYVC